MCYLLRSLPSSRAGPTAEGGTGAHVCVGDRQGPRLWAGMEAILLTETFTRSGSAVRSRGVRATSPCRCTLLLPPPSPQLPRPLLGVPGWAGSGVAPQSHPELSPHALAALCSRAGGCRQGLVSSVPLGPERGRCLKYKRGGTLSVVLARNGASPPRGEGGLDTPEPEGLAARAV